MSVGYTTAIHQSFESQMRVAWSGFVGRVF